MLLSLAVRDFVIVDDLSLDLSPGFTVLTGETGAGKSILIDALQLALGERAEADVVRDGAARAEVTAEFRLGDEAQQWLREQDLQGDGGSSTPAAAAAASSTAPPSPWGSCARSATCCSMCMASTRISRCCGRRRNWRCSTRTEAWRRRRRQ
jgi:energy-coupling factor transporter ATP-binding protein EcfA2